jgi:hypothetical protein
MDKYGMPLIQVETLKFSCRSRFWIGEEVTDRGVKKQKASIVRTIMVAIFIVFRFIDYNLV